MWRVLEPLALIYEKRKTLMLNRQKVKELELEKKKREDEFVSAEASHQTAHNELQSVSSKVVQTEQELGLLVEKIRGLKSQKANCEETLTKEDEFKQTASKKLENSKEDLSKAIGKKDSSSAVLSNAVKDEFIGPGK
jgi:chromosome segregation ATPase